MKRQFGLLLFRLLLASGVACALPLSHLMWGETYPGDGQRGFGFLIVFLGIGLVAGLLHGALGSLGQFLLRKSRPFYTMVVDIGLFVLFVAVLIHGGITAHYD